MTKTFPTALTLGVTPFWPQTRGLCPSISVTFHIRHSYPLRSVSDQLCEGQEGTNFSLQLSYFTFFFLISEQCFCLAVNTNSHLLLHNHTICQFSTTCLYAHFQFVHKKIWMEIPEIKNEITFYTCLRLGFTVTVCFWFLSVLMPSVCIE